MSDFGTDISEALDVALTEAWGQRNFDEQLRVRSAMWDSIPKKPTAGEPKVPIRLSHVPGHSSNKDRAVANAGHMDEDEYTLKMGDYFAHVTVDNKDLKGLRKDPIRLYDFVSKRIDHTLAGATEAMGYHLIGDGSGKLSEITAVTALAAGSARYTLTDDFSVMRFTKGMKLVCATTTQAGLRGTSGTTSVLTVEKVLAQSNQIVVSGTTAVTSTPVATDLLFRDGDHYTQNSNTFKLFAGLGAWIVDPATVTSAAWYGVDTSSDPLRYRGIYSDQSTQGSLYQALTAAVRDYKVFSGGGMNIGDKQMRKRMFLHTEARAALQAEVQNIPLAHPQQGSTTTLGHEALCVVIGGVKFDVFTDDFLAPTEAYVIDPETCKLYHYGDQVLEPADHGGTKWQRASWGYNCQFASYSAIGISAGSNNMKVILPDLSI